MSTLECVGWLLMMPLLSVVVIVIVVGLTFAAAEIWHKTNKMKLIAWAILILAFVGLACLCVASYREEQAKALAHLAEVEGDSDNRRTPLDCNEKLRVLYG